MSITLRRIAIGVCLLAHCAQASADWPMWRHDAARSGATQSPLPPNLRLAWTLQLPSQHTAWPASQYKLQFDAGYEPVVADGRMIVGSTVDDSVAAYDIATGNEVWRFYTEGPVRFAPAAWHDRVFVASDDGWLYSLSLSTGDLLWKVRGGPHQRPIIGNDRLISTWPVRGGPVVAEDTVYFTAGIWPSMGIFVQAVDCSSGNVVWSNSRISSLFVTHPHGADAFGTISPQGALVVNGNHLLVPGGRTLPAVFDRQTGELQHFDFGGKGSGGFSVMTAGKFSITAGELCLLEDGLPVTKLPSDVFDGERYIGTIGSDVAVTPYSEKVERTTGTDRRGRPVTTAKLEVATTRFRPEIPGAVQLVAGDVVYLAGDGKLAAYPIASNSDATTPVAPVWSAPIEGEVTTLLASDDRLFAVTKSGAIHCYANDAPATPVVHRPIASEWTAPAQADADIAVMIASAPLAGGYAVVAGADPELVRALVEQSQFRLVVLDADPARIDAIRKLAAGAGVYGTRLSAHASSLTDFHLPPYLADLFVVTTPPAAEELPHVFSTLRPYGGVAYLRTTNDEHADILAAATDSEHYPSADVGRTGEWTVRRRVGPLPDSGSWTHQYGDATNSVVSLEGRVKAPLSVLWFGGPPNDKVLPRHGHGPAPQVAGGRLFIEGADMLRCVDVYTGRLVWERELPGLGAFYDNTSHQPGAGEIGSNYVSLEDRVYVIHSGNLLELDATTGATTRTFSASAGAGPTRWSWLAVEGETLLATAAPVEVEGFQPIATPTVPKGMQAVIAPHSHWKYLAGPADNDAWKAIEFDDSAWSAGESGIGFNVDGVRTSLADVRGRSAVVRLRMEFDIADVDSLRGLQLMANYDDAFVASLNGREVVRTSFRGGGSEPYRVRSHSPAGYETFDIAAFRELLVQGHNVLAVEVHNAEPNDDDLLFDGYLLASLPLAPADAPAVADVLTPVSHASASRVLFAFDRHSGEVRWQRPALFSYRHNGICAGGGRVYCLDGMSEQKLSLMRRRGVAAESRPRLLALSLQTGDELWSTDEHVFGTFLNYSREYDVLLQGGSSARDRAKDETDTGLVAYQGASGEVLWRNLGLKHAGPCLLWNDRIITNGDGGFELLLLNGQTTGWQYSRMYGCNTAVGCLNMLTFRSGAAGFFDLASQSGTGNLGGFRSSCTSNLIPADGVLNAPDYTRTCECAYQLQASLAFIHEPDAEYWTFNDPEITPPSIESLGINLGAPGDRSDDDHTMWYEFPTLGGPSPPLDVQVEPSNVRWFAAHSSTLPAGDLNWVGASGVAGARRITWRFAPIPENKTATVRLVFADPDRLGAGERVFSVIVQGQTVLKDFDIAAAATSPGAVFVHDVPNVKLTDVLTIELEPGLAPRSSETLLSGVRVIFD